MKLSRFRPYAKTFYLSGALMGGMSLGFGAEPPTLEKLQEENSDLRRRLDALESMMTKEGIKSPADDAKKPVTLKGE